MKQQPVIQMTEGHKRLKQLSTALRHGLMPDDYEWDYGIILEQADCGSFGCAMGLASLMWPDQFGCGQVELIQCADLFSISVNEAEGLFISCQPSKSVDGVSAQDVADDIDALLAQKYPQEKQP